MKQWNNIITIHKTVRRTFSEFSRGHDLLADSLSFGNRPKIVLDAYSVSGFDIMGMIYIPKTEEVEDSRSQNGVLHMNGSVIAFPHCCFLWKVSTPKDVTFESLAVVLLLKPAVEYLFIGCNATLPARELNRIKTEFKKRNIVIEHLDIVIIFFPSNPLRLSKAK